MQAGRSNALRRLLADNDRILGHQLRHVSLTAAIERGIRKGKKVPEGRQPDQEKSTPSLRENSRDWKPQLKTQTRWGGPHTDQQGRRQGQSRAPRDLEDTSQGVHWKPRDQPRLSTEEQGTSQRQRPRRPPEAVKDELRTDRRWTPPDQPQLFEERVDPGRRQQWSPQNQRQSLHQGTSGEEQWKHRDKPRMFRDEHRTDQHLKSRDWPEASSGKSGTSRQWTPREQPRFVQQDPFANDERSAPSRKRADGNASSSEAPQSIPYTQANSEFIPGTFAVSAAIAAKRRTIYKLYIYIPADSPSSDVDNVAIQAQKAGVQVQRVRGKTWSDLLDKMAQGRPHNGYLLEASPLAIPTSISALKACRPVDDSGFEASTINTLSDSDKNDLKPSKLRRFPFYLFLDQILDPGNLGAIIRSAYFFGVDGIILLEHDTAPLTGFAVKASAGAIEYLPLRRVKKDVEFVRRSQENGWCFVGAVAARSSTSHSSKYVASEALSNQPTVLVLGSESEGIRPRIARLLDQTISIDTGAAHPGIDSLNVSVAASILIREFLRPYSKAVGNTNESEDMLS